MLGNVLGAVLTPILLHRLVDLALGIPRTLGIALVMLFLALGQPDLALDQVTFEIELCRHQRQPLFADLGEEPLDLPFV